MIDLFDVMEGYLAAEQLSRQRVKLREQAHVRTDMFASAMDSLTVKNTPAFKIGDGVVRKIEEFVDTIISKRGADPKIPLDNSQRRQAESLLDRQISLCEKLHSSLERLEELHDEVIRKHQECGRAPCECSKLAETIASCYEQAHAVLRESYKKVGALGRRLYGGSVNA